MAIQNGVYEQWSTDRIQDFVQVGIISYICDKILLNRNETAKTMYVDACACRHLWRCASR